MKKQRKPSRRVPWKSKVPLVLILPSIGGRPKLSNSNKQAHLTSLFGALLVNWNTRIVHIKNWQHFYWLCFAKYIGEDIYLLPTFLGQPVFLNSRTSVLRQTQVFSASVIQEQYKSSSHQVGFLLFLLAKIDQEPVYLKSFAPIPLRLPTLPNYHKNCDINLYINYHTWCKTPNNYMQAHSSVLLMVIWSRRKPESYVWKALQTQWYMEELPKCIYGNWTAHINWMEHVGVVKI